MENLNSTSRSQESQEWHKVTEDEIPSILVSLTKLWPESLSTYNFITESIKLGVKSRRTNITIFRNLQTGLLIAVSKGVYRRVVVSPIKNYSGIKTILEGNNCIDWNNGSVLFVAISLDFCKHLEDICPSIAKRVEFIDGICDSYWMPPEVAKALNVECPDEMYFSALEDCHTEIVNSTWNYGNSETYSMIRDIILFKETVGLFSRKDSRLISWALNAIYGIGFVYTIEEYRNNGYGTMVVKKSANILGKANVTPYLVTLQTNSVAKSVFKKCGFISLEPAVYMELGQNEDSV